MRLVHSLGVLALAALVGCGGGPTAPDAASMDSASPDAPPAIDARTTEDAPMSREDAVTADDAPGLDAAAVDAMSRLDAPGDGVDAGIDCSTIGCGAPVVCGEACDAPCGCCACGDGEVIDRGGMRYVCAGGCYAPAGGGGSGDPCGSSAECGPGLSCCYPCGIPGCMNVCEPSCAEGTPGCAGGCLLRA